MGGAEVGLLHLTNDVVMEERFPSLRPFLGQLGAVCEVTEAGRRFVEQRIQG